MVRFRGQNVVGCNGAWCVFKCSVSDGEVGVGSVGRQGTLVKTFLLKGAERDSWRYEEFVGQTEMEVIIQE